jgi:hypothetical protein
LEQSLGQVAGLVLFLARLLLHFARREDRDRRQGLDRLRALVELAAELHQHARAKERRRRRAGDDHFGLRRNGDLPLVSGRADNLQHVAARAFDRPRCRDLLAHRLLLLRDGAQR